MHVVISVLLQSRKFWWYLLLTCSMLLHHVIMTSYCCQRYAESLVTTLCSSRTVRQCTSTPRRARATVELQRLETSNFLATNLRPPNSPDFCPVDYKIWAVKVTEQWWGDTKHVSMLKDDTSITACELTLLILSIYITFNVTFDCYIFDYEIMPATLANTFLFILQGSALTYLWSGGRF